ncbi:MAG: class I SAM-dependent methyltransferase [Deltaproteobacteria bacterium]|nr:class I SAM-dependent methyltransferase [Deltaproteobacteria bacterium]
MPPRLRYFYPRFKGESFALLDIGCGNHSASITKKWFPRCRYSGVDREMYNIDETDLRSADHFFLLDLDRSNLEEIPDGHFDAILASHVIEHLHSGLKVLQILVSRKLKPGGLIYVEFPSIRSLALPNMPGTLNFCDDETHIRLYDVKDVANALLDNGMRIIRAGRRRCIDRILLMPIKILRETVRRHELRGGWFWDLLGFADFVFAQKT